VQLTAERLDVVQGERIGAVLVAGPSIVAIAAQGGVAYLRHTIEDIGFGDVAVTLTVPTGWTRGRNVPTPDGLEVLTWVEGVPVRTASLARALTGDLRVLDAWATDASRDDAAGPPSPYAIVRFPAACVLGVVRVFGVAYPVREVGAC
jgi:hypothetical protein